VRALAGLEDERRAGVPDPTDIAARAGGRRRSHGPILAPLPNHDPRVHAPAGKCDIRGRKKEGVVNSLRFGQEAPGFSLPSTAGNQTTLADFKGKSDVVLVFYCYDWGSI
jgi:hypothetical protein